MAGKENLYLMTWRGLSLHAIDLCYILWYSHVSSVNTAETLRLRGEQCTVASQAQYCRL